MLLLLLRALDRVPAYRHWAPDCPHEAVSAVRSNFSASACLLEAAMAWQLLRSTAVRCTWLLQLPAHGPACTNIGVVMLKLHGHQLHWVMQASRSLSIDFTQRPSVCVCFCTAVGWSEHRPRERSVLQLVPAMCGRWEINVPLSMARQRKLKASSACTMLQATP